MTWRIRTRVAAITAIFVVVAVAGWFVGARLSRSHTSSDEVRREWRGPVPRQPPTATTGEWRVRRVGPPSVYQARPAEEWQGMSVDVSTLVTCESTAFCGLAASCRDGRCGPCVADYDCLDGEVCVLDHCVRAELASCRSRTECGADELCILTGYSADPRGNADMRAFCSSNSGGRPQRLDSEGRETIPDVPTPVRPDEMLDGLKQ